LATWDRTLRFVAAVLLLSYVIAGGPFWGWGGIYFLMTAAWGLCPIYAFFKIKTIRASNNSFNTQSIKRP
jgi:hypothetical protein